MCVCIRGTPRTISSYRVRDRRIATRRSRPRSMRSASSPLKAAGSSSSEDRTRRGCRGFIGTTSGLTIVASSVGIPSAIVNAITTDAQLWNKDVRFALKPVRLADGTMLTQRQLTSYPWRWRVFDAAVHGRSGAQPVINAADEILQTAKEVVALASGRSAEFEAQYDTAALLSRWRHELTLPYYYGTSRPSLAFLERYKNEFLPETSDVA